MITIPDNCFMITAQSPVLAREVRADGRTVEHYREFDISIVGGYLDPQTQQIVHCAAGQQQETFEERVSFTDGFIPEDYTVIANRQ